MRSLIQLILLSVVLVSSMAYAGEKVSETLPLNDASKVIIENQRGQVNVIGSNDNFVSVEGELDDDAQAFIFEQSGATITIKVQMPNSKRNWGNNDKRGSILTITIPRQVRVGFNGVSSDIEISDFIQGVDIKTVSGEVSAKHLQKNIDINTISGDIESELLSGKVQLSTVSGDLDDEKSSGRLLIKSVSGSIKTTTNAKEVSAETVSGDIKLNLASIDELSVSSVSGDSDVSLLLNPQATVKLSSVSGEFTLKFAERTQANFALKTNAGGSIKNKITNDKAHRSKFGPNEKLSFTTGDGNGSVKVTTVSGDIILLAN